MTPPPHPNEMASAMPTTPETDPLQMAQHFAARFKEERAETKRLRTALDEANATIRALSVSAPITPAPALAGLEETLRSVLRSELQASLPPLYALPPSLPGSQAPSLGDVGSRPGSAARSEAGVLPAQEAFSSPDEGSPRSGWTDNLMVIDDRATEGGGSGRSRIPRPSTSSSAPSILPTTVRVDREQLSAMLAQTRALHAQLEARDACIIQLKGSLANLVEEKRRADQQTEEARDWAGWYKARAEMGGGAPAVVGEKRARDEGAEEEAVAGDATWTLAHVQQLVAKYDTLLGAHLTQRAAAATALAKLEEGCPSCGCPLTGEQ